MRRSKHSKYKRHVVSSTLFSMTAKLNGMEGWGKRARRHETSWIHFWCNNDYKRTWQYSGKHKEESDTFYCIYECYERLIHVAFYVVLLIRITNLTNEINQFSVNTPSPSDNTLTKSNNEYVVETIKPDFHNHVFPKYILILLSHLFFSLPRGCFLRGLTIRIFTELLSYPILVKFPAHPILLGFNNVDSKGDKY